MASPTSPLVRTHTPPPQILDFCDRAFAPEAPLPARVRLTQHGEMFRDPGSRPLSFTAVEEIAVDTVGYSWHGRCSVAPLVALHIYDGYEDGQGWMWGRVAGVPFLRRRGPEVTAASALRYLAELPWAPQAMVANSTLTWCMRGDRLVEVATVADGAVRTMSLHLNPDGDIVRTFTGARHRDRDGMRAWSGVFSDYATLGCVRIPTVAEARWELPAGPFTYWRGYVTGLELIP